MNLISCNGCGIVLDKHKLRFNWDIYNDDGSIKLDRAAWDGDRYVPFVRCPVCGEQILDSDR